RRNRPQPRFASLHAPRPAERDPSTVGRPRRTDGVALGEKPLAPIGDRNYPELAVAQARTGLAHTLSGHGDLLSVRRPCRVVAKVRETPNGLAGRSHQEDAPAFALGAERDLLPVEGDSGSPVVVLGVCGEVHGVASSDADRVDVVVA